MWPCNGNRCNKCPYINRTSSINIYGKSFEIRSNLNCNSSNLIYVISCIKCNIHYIGQTQNPLRIRLSKHISDINTQKDTNISKHFNSHSENLDATFRITPVLYIPDTNYRKIVEMKLIKSFDTLCPKGLNDRFDPYNSDDNLVPIIVPFSNRSQIFAHNLKSIAVKHNVTRSRIVTAYTRSRNLKEILK